MEIAVYLLLACASAALVIYALGFWATLKHLSMESPELPAESLPPISLLKPLKGVEDSLAANLRTFFAQEYPAGFEVIFCTTDDDDPALEIARQVAAEFPEVPSRFVLSDAGFGGNPKVANLSGALAEASFDHVLQSDANVRVKPDYLSKLVSEMKARDASMITSPVIGVGERSAGAAMENLQLSAFIAPGMCAALHVAGISVVVGKAMLFRRSDLETVGGLEYVRNILCEDFVLGRRFRERGHTVVLSTTMIENVNHDIGVQAFLSRHSRWLKMRVVLHLPGFFADLFANPVPLAGAAWLASGLDQDIGLIVFGLTMMKMATDSFLIRATRGHSMALHHLVLAPVKDTLMALIWVYACFSRTVVWRGTRIRFGKDSEIIAPDDTDAEALPARS